MTLGTLYSATVIPIHTRLRPHNLPIPEPLPILQKFPAIYLLTLVYRIVLLEAYSLFQNYLVTLDQVRYYFLLILRVASVWRLIRSCPFIKNFLN